MSDTPRTDALLDKLGVSDARTGDAGALRDLARQLERDAERYRWLRERCVQWYPGPKFFFSTHTLDAEVDKAMKENPLGPGDAR